MWPGGIERSDATLTMASSGSARALIRSTTASSASRSFASPYLVIFGIVLGISSHPPWSVPFGVGNANSSNIPLAEPPDRPKLP